MRENEIGKQVVDAAYQIHCRLGPGLLESVYEFALTKEFQKRGLSFERQKSIPVTYEDEILEVAFRADIVVENKVLLELKSVEAIHDIHKKQVLTYLRLSGCRLGYLVNFNVGRIKDGISRIVNQLPEENSNSYNLRGVGENSLSL